MDEVPVPPQGMLELLYRPRDDTSIYIARNPANSFPIADCNLEYLFACLSLDNVLTLFNAMLLEKKILLLSKSYSLLHNVGNGLIALLFPFYWQFVFFPILPRGLMNFIYAPMPFIMGANSSYGLEYKQNKEVRLELLGMLV